MRSPRHKEETREADVLNTIPLVREFYRNHSTKGESSGDEGTSDTFPPTRSSHIAYISGTSDNPDWSGVTEVT